MNKYTKIFFLTIFLFPFCLRAEEPISDADFWSGLSSIAKQSENPVYSICVIRNGVSQTRDFQPATRCHNCYSVAKLFTVTAIGILEDRGLLNTDDEIYPIFKDKFPENFDPKWKKVRIRDVITHRIGFENGFLDIDVDNMRHWESSDFLKIVLSHPLKYEPGEKSVYSDAAFYLASRIVTEVSGEKLDDFLIRELANPLKFEEFAYSKCPEGYPMGATGLYISTEDMAKLGQLYVQKGVWDGKRILSEEFVEKVFREGFELHPVRESKNAFGKGGMNGQFLYLNRQTGTVFALHSFEGNRNELIEYVLNNDDKTSGVSSEE